ncbi:hypothetical protein [Cryobacterium psychrophilum]|uniref:Nucleotidyltransferase family protein n=1 Tax=Cryobacterium psychrophilum TaxID=41988 RepID=A0A4Y8KS31_9MICO|nr:hypothetical protein [Cryobacterium psychrophilum]TDW31412.1 hypothetical protein EDD25_3226 [Cryobacterium psychrophilum]TFD78854.1 hypothetical protein E3T53_08685 [Cryobacterium psychrophilum]
MTVIQMLVLGNKSSQAWHALFDLAEKVPNNWCLVGGQMVHLWCIERGVTPNRPTDDADAVLDVRAQPSILHDVTKALVDIGFESAGQSPEGHQHRWIRGDATLDLLIPEHVGERAAARTGVTGGTTLEARGSNQAIDRAELVTVNHDGREALIWRPNLLGALVLKAAAYTVPLDQGVKRHLIDFAVLTTLITRGDQLAGQTSKRDRELLKNAIGAIRMDGTIITTIDGADLGIERLLVALSA